MVLDWTLPDFEGIEICRRLRSSGDTTPVLMLTAHDDVDERVQACLDLGVDDYLTKPFELKELQARVRAQLRRSNYSSSEPATRVSPGGPAHRSAFTRRAPRREAAEAVAANSICWPISCNTTIRCNPGRPSWTTCGEHRS